MCHSLPKRKYNQCGWLTQLTGKNHANVQLYQFVNEHDENGNVVASNQIFNAHSPFIRQIGMVYDNSDRLWTEEMYVGGNQEIRTYTYDPAHNRIQLLTNYDPPKDIPPMGLCIASLQNTLPNSLNQIEESDTLYVNSLGTPIGGTKIVYTYDLNGNRETRKKYVGEVTAGVLSYPGFPGSPNESGNYWFNSQGQLTELEHTGSANHLYTWVYDHRGRRVSFTDDDGTTTNQQLFSFSGGTSIFECPAEGSAGDSVWYARAYGMGGGIGDIQLTFQSGSPSGIYTTHSNFRGDVILKAEYSTAPTWMATYDAWGEVTQTGTSPNRQYSNSKDRDVDGLANEGFRYRDPETGAFLSRDPAGMVDGPNLYNYVSQNPWSSVDPEGLQEGYSPDPNGVSNAQIIGRLKFLNSIIGDPKNAKYLGKATASDLDSPFMDTRGYAVIRDADGRIPSVVRLELSKAQEEHYLLSRVLKVRANLQGKGTHYWQNIINMEFPGGPPPAARYLLTPSRSWIMAQEDVNMLDAAKDLGFIWLTSWTFELGGYALSAAATARASAAARGAKYAYSEEELFSGASTLKTPDIPIRYVDDLAEKRGAFGLYENGEISVQSGLPAAVEKGVIRHEYAHVIYEKYFPWMSKLYFRSNIAKVVEEIGVHTYATHNLFKALQFSIRYIKVKPFSVELVVLGGGVYGLRSLKNYFETLR